LLPHFDQISSRDYEHLNDLSQLRFLVIDEADRMVNQRGSFPELSNILDAVHRANPMEESDDVDQLDETESDDNQNRMLRLPGIPGEAKVAMISDEILQQLQKCRETDRQEVNEVEDEEFEKLVNNPEDDVDSTVLSLPARPPVHRQTLIFSATLTLQPSKQQGKKWIGREMGGVIGGILEKTRAKGKTKIIDLTNGSQRGIVREVVSGKSGSNDEVKVQKDAQQLDKTKYRLPPGLKLQQIKCTKLHKDSHLYAYLMTTTDGASGPSLIFCNSIAAVRRVGATLQTLGLNVRILHAQMQQVRLFWAYFEFRTTL
jgi:ATP-dependent RNA helicase DDX24/MAK5